MGGSIPAAIQLPGGGGEDLSRLPSSWGGRRPRAFSSCTKSTIRRTFTPLGLGSMKTMIDTGAWGLLFNVLTFTVVSHFTRK